MIEAPLVTQHRLKELLAYDPETGLFTRRVSRQRHKKGTVAGCLTNEGYVVIRIEGRNYLAHRLAWLYMTGRWPRDEIDHRDTVKTNNKFANIREATRTENNRNRDGWNGRLPKRVEKSGGKFRASIKVDGKSLHLGSFDTPQMASLAYRRAAKEHFGDFARG